MEKIKPRQTLWPWLSLVALGLLCLLFFQTGQEVTLEIPKGASAFQVGELLTQNKVLRFSVFFRQFAKLSHLDKHLKPGDYKLREHMSSLQVLWALFHGQKNYIRITIPEGWRAEEIADRLQAQGVCSANSFLEIVRRKKLEGKLFPSTYFFDPETPASTVVRVMEEEFEQQTAPLFREYQAQKISSKEALILASIVEREAVIALEKPLIAAVYMNRLNKKRRLEADPTVQYALGYNQRQKTYWKKGVNFKDLLTPSPYNTYINTGLPPSPICNPGLKSIQATLSPAKIDALFFVADQTGRHIFNINFNEHIKAKQRIKKDQEELKKKKK
ncbi:MAG: endolytic transglycosylase MltG [Elusimicrobia bacterium]|nr:endolytic transglycosylase MltG [Elusimicrobiota bacterium]